MKDLNVLIATVAWFLGIALAQGRWKLAALFPPYAFYEVAKWGLSEAQTICPL